MSNIRLNIWNTTIGYLAWDKANQTSVLELDEGYRSAPFNLSPLLIDKSTNTHFGGTYNSLFYGLPAFVADSLPDYFGNRIFQEWLASNQIREQELNPVERLMYIGKRGVGALEFEPGKPVLNEIDQVDFNELAMIADKIIKHKYKISDYLKNQKALQHILNIGASIGGAQAKVLVAVNTQTGEIKAGDVIHDQKGFDYYIVKLSHDKSTLWGKEKMLVEYVYHIMAKYAGLNLPEAELLHTPKAVHFKVKRFDRKEGEKIHLQTLSAMTGYADNTKPFSYEEFFIVLEKLKVPHADKLSLFRQMVFNIATGNMNDHMKNFSFLMHPDGRWRLAPVYDLTYPFDPYQPNVKYHKMTVNRKNNQIEQKDVLELAAKVGIERPYRMILQVVDAAVQFSAISKAFGLKNKTTSIIQSEIEANCKRLMNQIL